MAGMINLDKLIEVEVTSHYEDSALSKIQNTVEEASGRQAKTQKLITIFGEVYTPVLVFLSIWLSLLSYFFADIDVY